MRRQATAVGAALAALALLGCTSPPVGHAELHLLGTWTGVGNADGDGVMEMVVTEAEADGTAFGGEVTISLGGAQVTEPIQAKMTPHGHLAGAVGARAAIEVHITDPSTLDYCFAQYGTDPAFACSRLTRIP